MLPDLGLGALLEDHEHTPVQRRALLGLAQRLEPRIAAQQSGTFAIHTEQKPAHPDGPNPRGAIQHLKYAFFITQTRESLSRDIEAGKSSSQFFRFFPAAHTCVQLRDGVEKVYDRGRIYYRPDLATSAQALRVLQESDGQVRYIASLMILNQIRKEL